MLFSIRKKFEYNWTKAPSGFNSVYFFELFTGEYREIFIIHSNTSPAVSVKWLSYRSSIIQHSQRIIHTVCVCCDLHAGPILPTHFANTYRWLSARLQLTMESRQSCAKPAMYKRSKGKNKTLFWALWPLQWRHMRVTVYQLQTT